MDISTPLENFHQKSSMERQKCQSKVISQGCKILPWSTIFVKGFTFLTFQWMFEWRLWEWTKDWTLIVKQFCRIMMGLWWESSDSSPVPAGNIFLGAGDLKVMQVQFVTHLSSQGTAQPSERAGWIKVPVKINLILQGMVLFLAGIEGVSTIPKVLFIQDGVMYDDDDDGDAGHWQTALQPLCCLSLPPTRQERQEELIALETTHSPLTMVCVKHHRECPVGRVQESPTLLGSAGQARAESRDYLQQFPKGCSHSSCSPWLLRWGFLQCPLSQCSQ